MHAELVLRAGIVVGFLWAVRRLAGAGRVAPMDILVALIIGTLGQAMLLGKVSLPEGFLAIGFLVWVHLLSIVICRYSPRLRALVWGPSLALVSDGKVQRPTLARAGIGNDALSMLLREAGIVRLSDVREMRLEPDDALTVLRGDDAQPVTTGELDAVRLAVPEEERWRSAA